MASWRKLTSIGSPDEVASQFESPHARQMVANVLSNDIPPASGAVADSPEPEEPLPLPADHPLQRERMRLDTSWQPARREYEDSRHTLENFPRTFSRNTTDGRMEKIDPRTGDSLPYAPRELALWQKDREEVQGRHDRAKRSYDQLRPRDEYLNGLIDEDRKRSAAATPTTMELRTTDPLGPVAASTDEGAQTLADGISPHPYMPPGAKTSAPNAGPASPTPPDGIPAVPAAPGSPVAPVNPKAPVPPLTPAVPAALNATTPPVDDGETLMEAPAPEPVQGRLSPQEGLPAVPYTTPHPRLRPLSPFERDGLTQDAIGLQGLQQDDHHGFTTLQDKSGGLLGMIDEPEDAQPALVLHEDARKQRDINRALAKGITSSVPVYTRTAPENFSRRDEAGYLAAVELAVTDPTHYREDGTATDELDKRLRKIGATPDAILERVDAGQLSVQNGEALMKTLYHQTLTSPDPEDPATFQEWLKSNTAAADKKLQETYGNPALYDQHSVGRRWEDAKSSALGYNHGAQNEIKRDFYRDWYEENRGKPGVTRERLHQLMDLDVADQASAKDTAVSVGNKALKIVGMGAAATGGIFAGLVKDFGAAEVSLFGNQDAKDELEKAWRLRGRNTVDWNDSAKRNLQVWFTEKGGRVMSKFNSAANEFQHVMDEEEDKPGGPDQARIDEAEKKVRTAALALHQISLDRKWPVTGDDLDPAKDAALRSSLARYRQSGDPREFALYKDRMLMSNGRRQVSAELEEMTRGKSDWEKELYRNMYAGGQDLTMEVGGDLLSAGTSKAVQGALRARGAVRAAYAVKRIRRGLEALEGVGLILPKHGRPLTAVERAHNLAIDAAKNVGTGFAKSVGSPDADPANDALATVAKTVITRPLGEGPKPKPAPFNPSAPPLPPPALPTRGQRIAEHLRTANGVLEKAKIDPASLLDAGVEATLGEDKDEPTAPVTPATHRQPASYDPGEPLEPTLYKLPPIYNSVYQAIRRQETMDQIVHKQHLSPKAFSNILDVIRSKRGL